MAIKIEKITVKNLGPIQAFSEELGPFNLIYSKNECGKTFLTEFIIRSLFRNIKRWQFRDKGSGKVVVSGLDCERLVEFSPDTGKKLEDYWENEQYGMPASMVKLLVSKGGESSIEETSEGIGKNFIREIFSGISLLDKIDDDKNISRTIKSADFEPGNINIGNAGEGKTHRQLKEDISRLSRVFSEIESTYPGGVIESYKNEAKRLGEWRDKLYKAKCYEAYKVSEKIKELSKELKNIDEDKLNSLYGEITIYENKKSEFKSKVGQGEELKEKCLDYEWLQKALPIYEKLSFGATKNPKPLFAVLAAIFVLAAILFAIFNMPFGTILSVLAAAGSAIVYIFRLLKFSANAGSNEELNKLKKVFMQKTGRELTDMAVLKEEIDRQQASYEKSGLLRTQQDQLKSEISSTKFSIQQKFKEILADSIPEDKWMSIYNNTRAQIRNLKEDVEVWHSKLLELGVRDAEFLSEDPRVSFSYEDYEKAQQELLSIEQIISDKQSQMSSLKHSVCNETGDDVTIDWEHLIENLRNKMIEKEISLNNVEAHIIAGIIVHREITALRQEEDNKILEGLKSEVVLTPLKSITRNYRNLSIEGNSLVVSDDFKDYYIKDLSTGAREQVMLALRIGFASKILKQDRLFLILDDALQHSDWDRREILVDKLKDIALGGWQVIYFSMDDHIKGLFDKAGKNFKNGDYKYIELGK